MAWLEVHLSYVISSSPVPILSLFYIHVPIVTQSFFCFNPRCTRCTHNILHVCSNPPFFCIFCFHLNLTRQSILRCSFDGAKIVVAQRPVRAGPCRVNQDFNGKSRNQMGTKWRYEGSMNQQPNWGRGWVPMDWRDCYWICWKWLRDSKSRRIATRCASPFLLCFASNIKTLAIFMWVTVKMVEDHFSIAGYFVKDVHETL